MLNEDKKDRFDLESTMREITDSVVFELLSIFDIDITPEQAQTESTVSARLEPLRILYEKSHGLEPLPMKQVTTLSKPAAPHYEYLTDLDSDAGEVRVLEILGASFLLYQPYYEPRMAGENLDHSRSRSPITISQHHLSGPFYPV